MTTIKIQSAYDVLKDYVGDKSLCTPDSVFIGGKANAAKDIPWNEVEILAQELDSMVDWEQNPVLASLIVRGAARVLDAVRMVNAESKQGYKGAAARGAQLVVSPIRVADLLLYNASSSTLADYPKTTWETAITARGAAAWSGTSTYNNEMLVSSLPMLSHVYLGFINPIDVPKMDQIQLIKDGDPMAVETLSFGWRQTFGDNQCPVHELKQPWVIPPGAKYYIACSYYLTGDDLTQPIGFTVKRATDILSALA
jgi:hypothetical protein